jgi:alkylresorcinol/alkylpyrone synthase
MDVGLLSLATAVPPHKVAQRDVVEGARMAFREQFEDFDRLAAVFFSAGIEERYTVKPPLWYLQPQDWPSRSEAYLEGALALFIAAAVKALDQADLHPRDVDTIVTVSSTGIAAPSLEARAMEKLGFRRDVSRVPVFGLGCAGGAAGLALGAELASARPGSIVLVVTVELCSLAVRGDLATKANMVALALFGDGAAAAVLRAGPGGRIQIVEAGHHTWTDTLEIMGWSVDPIGFGVIFDQSIPRFAWDNIAGALDGILAAQGLERGDIKRFICHPGGRKVLEAIEGALELPTQSLNHEREVLKRYGNMSAPTALFVLDRVLQGVLPEKSLLVALGPGFSVATVTLAAPAA